MRATEAAVTAVLLAGLPGVSAPASAADGADRLVRQSDDPAGWPFTVDEGSLSCMRMGQASHVFFSEPWPPYDLDTMSFPYVPRSVAVTSDPLVLVFVNLGDRSLLRSFATLEELILRMAPYEQAGRMQCTSADGGSD